MKITITLQQLPLIPPGPFHCSIFSIPASRSRIGCPSFSWYSGHTISPSWSMIRWRTSVETSGVSAGVTKTCLFWSGRALSPKFTDDSISVSAHRSFLINITPSDFKCRSRTALWYPVTTIISWIPTLFSERIECRIIVEFSKQSNGFISSMRVEIPTAGITADVFAAFHLHSPWFTAPFVISILQ